jgi:hypothetical protein
VRGSKIAGEQLEMDYYLPQRWELVAEELERVLGAGAAVEHDFVFLWVLSSDHAIAVPHFCLQHDDLVS